jgi:sulfur-oxidizing protein SoxY
MAGFSLLWPGISRATPPGGTGVSAAAAGSNGAGVIAATGAEVVLTVPSRVEDGAFVPVTVDSRLPETTEISILVDSNPVPLAVQFTIPEGTDPFVSTRIRMAESGTIQALVRCGNKLYSARAETKVTVGGCS